MFGAQGSFAQGLEVWITDGTSAGTQLLKDIWPNAGWSNPGGQSGVVHEFVSMGDGRVIFNADDGSNGLEPWITDGTPAGTVRLFDINTGVGGSNPNSASNVGLVINTLRPRRSDATSPRRTKSYIVERPTPNNRAASITV